MSGRVDSGASHSCAIDADGNIRCWGGGAAGQLGYGNTETIGDNESPASAGSVDLGSGRHALTVTAGASHTCAIANDGTVRCWGSGSLGQLGYGNTTAIGDNETPAAVGAVDLGGRSATAISAGTNFTCALLDNGSVRCWGLGTTGRLGYGTSTTIGDNETPAAAGPVDLGTGRTATAIATGVEHTCAILDNGSVRCWGGNSWGQLGYGHTATIGDNETPGSVAPVDLGPGRTATAISAGNGFTCALLDNGSVRCWGIGGAGQLGYGSTTSIGDNESPSAAGPVSLGGSAVALAVGWNHTCAILVNGAMRCWGYNFEGQLGYGNTNWVGDDESPSSLSPLNLGAGRSAVAVSGGESHTCAWLDNGTMRCWGLGGSGRLGYGNTTSIGDNESPAAAGPLDLGAAEGVLSIATGSSHACAVLYDGTVRCWGAGSLGQLGYGNTATIGDNESPGAAGPVDLGAGRSAVSVAAGNSHTCAILDNGTVRCWGNGANGRLGYANIANVGDDETPGSVGSVDLGAGRSAIAIAAGGSHTCAALDDGTVRCWGAGESGRLGYGNTLSVGDDETPGSVGAVVLGGSAIGIATGGFHSCAVLGDHTLRCWGFNTTGQLGYGNTTTIGDNESPSVAGAVGVGRSARSVAGGNGSSCAPLDNGTLRCWGANNLGQLGYGNTTYIGDNELPTAAGPLDLGTGRNARSVATGTNHGCAVLDNGSVRCWGVGTSGQLGYGNTANIGDTETPGTVAPVDLGSGRTALSVATGNSLSCALLDNGTVRCWGTNTSGQLGYGNTVQIGDNESPSAAGPVDFVDDAPLAVNDSTSVAEDAPATAIDVLANDTDVDGGPKTVNSKTNGAHGVVAITGGGAGLTYLPDAGYCGPDSFTYTLNGGSAATVSVSVTCVDDPPLAVKDSATLVEDATATTINVLANDTDPDGGPKTIASKTNGGHGTVAITGAGLELTYKPDPDYCGADSFTYTLNGGSEATVTVMVSCVDDGPVAVNDSTTMTEDSSATAIDVLANDTDVDGGPKTVNSKTNGAHGVVAITGGGVGLTYLPDPDYCGADSFTYTLNGGSQATVSVAVNCVDDPSVAVNDAATVVEDAVATAIDILGNDTDVDGGVKAVESKTEGAHGVVSITGGGSGITYLPASNYCGPDSFTYTLTGGSSATVSVTVTCVDDLPVAVSDLKTVAEDSSAVALDVLANDTDVDGGPKLVADKTNGSHGDVAITGGGSGLVYTPEPGYCGPDSFSYQLNGGSTASVSVTVTCVDDPPTAVDDAAGVAEDSSATQIDVRANDADTDGGPKTIESKTDGSHGTVAITGGGAGLTYLPDAGYCGPDSFTYTLNGGSTATVSITVACLDNGPSAVSDSATLDEDAPPTAIDVLANDTDPDGGPKSVESKTNGAHGTTAITGGGSGVTYAPDPDYCGADSFTYTLNGGSQAAVSVTVTCVDDPSFAVNDSATLVEDAAAKAIDVLANDTDIDGGAKSIEAKTNGAHGTASITGAGAGLTYLPDPDYCGPDSFTYTLNGGSEATVSVTVTCVDDAPTAVDDADTIQEDAPATVIDVLANDTDIDGGPKSLGGRTNGAHGSVAIIGTGAALTYTPAADHCGPDSFTYTLNGGSQATVAITVACADDPLPPDPGSGAQAPAQAIVQAPLPPPASSAPVVNITPGIGVVSGRRHPRVAVKGSFAFFTLTCKHPDKDCAGTVRITADVPSVALGPAEKVTLVKGRFRIAAGRSVLVRAKLTRVGLGVLRKRSLRGVGARMAIVDAGNGERGKIEVNLVRRPKASLLPGASGGAR